MEAHKAKTVAKQPEYLSTFETFTNDDYDRLCHQDFRTIRYKREEFFTDKTELVESLAESNKNVELNKRRKCHQNDL